MKYKKLFRDLHDFGVSRPDLNLNQFKQMCAIIWMNMSPTEQNLFDDEFNIIRIQMSTQESIKGTLKRIKKKNKK